MTNHIDQLAQWWEGAEESDDFYPGDTWIKRTQAQTGGYVYDVGRVTSKKRYYEARVLSRAPKPKPAWHDAVAVIATWNSGGDGEYADLWTYNGAGMWVNARGAEVHRDYLTDVTPLIEAKVTDEMVLRALNASAGLDLSHLTAFKRNEVEDMRFALSAALGIEEGDL